MKYFAILTLAATAVFTSSCSNTAPPRASGGVAAYQAYDLPATRPTNPSNVSVKVSISNQMAYVMEGNKPLLVTPVSVGKSATPTPRGSFRAYSKQAKRRANGHGWATSGSQARQFRRGKQPKGWKFIGTPMPYWVEFKPGYGFHTGWQKPYPCTHGCLRLHENVAPKFFSIVPKGAKINIANSQPEDSTIGRNIRRAPDAGPLPDYSPSMYIGDGYFSRHKAPRFN